MQSLPLGIQRNYLPLDVPADLKSAVKKGSTYNTGGFVIPQQKEKHTPLLRISNPQSLKRLGHFLTPDFNALMTEISANIAEGNKVVLDNFGSFKLGIRTSPAVSAKKFT